MTAAAQQASVYSNACWRRGLAIAAAPSVSKKALRQAQQLKTGGKKVQEALRKQMEDEEARARGEDPALKDKGETHDTLEQTQGRRAVGEPWCCLWVQRRRSSLARG
jgi:hypothetical protein